MLAVAVTVAASALLTAVVTRGGGEDGAPQDTGSEPIAHVHGLGVNRADDLLYVATHHGVYRIAGDDADRVGEGEQDTMGFTIAGPDRFLASGHPDSAGFQAGQPPLLGLIESTNGGKTWAPVSLLGKADFHALAFVHGRIYGADSSGSRFLVSTDGSAWDTRSTVALRSFAVDPERPDHILAAGEPGLLDSSDGGRTWTPVSGPALVVLSWAAGAGLYGLDGGGSVHRSTDGGATWVEAGAVPGEPEALLAGEALYAATADEQGGTSLYRSADSGGSWRRFYSGGGD